MVRETEGNILAGSFKRTSRKAVTGHFSPNLDVLLKAAILSAAVVIRIRQHDDID